MAAQTLYHSSRFTSSLTTLQISSCSSRRANWAVPCRCSGFANLHLSKARPETGPGHRFPLYAVAESTEVAEGAALPSTGLSMSLKVEGTLADSLISKVKGVLMDIEGISNLNVYTAEGVATVELVKETTIQATGEASSIIEKIQAEGFKVQNLGISFNDPSADADEDIAYEYESTE
ncbi:hypothetical protein KP509_01G033000 [Ceratopteris richardii]|uniref:HMA domain-containing protein n=1 Tax=Ceratopteris richardii TaxID=49495 RepID=A0A8T2VJQ9_CERRI|nr:hypothetical protein KP509_01G033000 [Ceratopteris richardii]